MIRQRVSRSLNSDVTKNLTIIKDKSEVTSTARLKNCFDIVRWCVSNNRTLKL